MMNEGVDTQWFTRLIEVTAIAWGIRDGAADLMTTGISSRVKVPRLSTGQHTPRPVDVAEAAKIGAQLRPRQLPGRDGRIEVMR